MRSNRRHVSKVRSATVFAGEAALTKRNESGQPGTLTRSVYEQIRTDLLTGKFRPGEKLGAEALRERFKTGSSPVREALNRLLAEGFVALIEQKGFRVAPVSAEELSELVTARCWIDGAAVTECVRRFDAKWEEGLILAHHRLSRTSRGQRGRTDNPDWEILHKAFHTTLVGGCGTRWIVKISEQLFDAAERYRLLAIEYVPERDELEEHRLIVDACIERNAEKAVNLLKRHYGQSFNILAGSLAHSPANVGG
jgi:GntR family transcriptional regulator, carbon starvation induced regulator